MNFLQWVPVSVEAFVINLRSRLNWRALLNIFPQRIEDLFPRLVLDLIFGVYGYFLSCIHLLNEIIEILRRVIVRLVLVIQSVWYIESFAELLRLQHEYLEVKRRYTAERAFLRYDEFENSMNFLLASGSRVCLREINSFTDLYSHVCDVFTFIRNLSRFMRRAILYIRAKRVNQRTARWVIVVDNLRNQARNFADDEWVMFR